MIKREVKSKITVHVIEAPCHGATADDVLKAADHQRKSLKDSSAHSREDRSSVWALIDTEVEPHRVSAAHDAKKKAESKGVKTALSKPCFEVWTLAHLADTGEAFSGCSAVLQKVKSAWKAEFQSEFAKPQADYAKLAILRHKAASRAKARTPDKDQSWTEVYKVVEEIDALFNQPEGSQNIP
ncbi:MAG: RloB domain-containing protein [Phycisphaeraceae bacterium]|nr:RloB domain-containing protein [Phycisphaeraceae bacterium]